MKYLLDTCVISDFVKGHEGVRQKILSASPYQIAVSTITQMEIEYGLAINAARAKKIQGALRAFLQSIHILPFTTEDAAASALARAHLKQKGKPIGPYDILLAGVALNRGLVFVTSNEREFTRLSNLEIESWRNT